MEQDEIDSTNVSTKLVRNLDTGEISRVNDWGDIDKLSENSTSDKNYVSATRSNPPISTDQTLSENSEKGKTTLHATHSNSTQNHVELINETKNETNQSNGIDPPVKIDKTIYNKDEDEKKNTRTTFCFGPKDQMLPTMKQLSKSEVKITISDLINNSIQSTSTQLPTKEEILAQQEINYDLPPLYHEATEFPTIPPNWFHHTQLSPVMEDEIKRNFNSDGRTTSAISTNRLQNPNNCPSTSVNCEGMEIVGTKFYPIDRCAQRSISNNPTNRDLIRLPDGLKLIEFQPSSPAPILNTDTDDLKWFLRCMDISPVSIPHPNEERNPHARTYPKVEGTNTKKPWTWIATPYYQRGYWGRGLFENGENSKQKFIEKEQQPIYELTPIETNVLTSEVTFGDTTTLSKTPNPTWNFGSKKTTLSMIPNSTRDYASSTTTLSTISKPTREDSQKEATLSIPPQIPKLKAKLKRNPTGTSTKNPKEMPSKSTYFENKIPTDPQIPKKRVSLLKLAGITIFEPKVQFCVTLKWPIPTDYNDIESYPFLFESLPSLFNNHGICAARTIIAYQNGQRYYQVPFINLSNESITLNDKTVMGTVVEL